MTDAKIRDTYKLRGTACIECRNSKTRCQNPTTGAKGGCLRCLQQNKQCTLYLPSQIASVETSTTLAASRSFSPQLHAQQSQSRTPLFDHHCTEGRLEIDSNLDMDVSPNFQREATQATFCKFAGIGLACFSVISYPKHANELQQRLTHYLAVGAIKLDIWLNPYSVRR